MRPQVAMQQWLVTYHGAPLQRTHTLAEAKSIAAVWRRRCRANRAHLAPAWWGVWPMDGPINPVDAQAIHVDRLPTDRG